METDERSARRARLAQPPAQPGHPPREGGWSIATPAPNEFVFIDAQGRPVPCGHPLPGSTRALDMDLPNMSLMAGDGGKMDRQFVISVLLGRRDCRRRAPAVA